MTGVSEFDLVARIATLTAQHRDDVTLGIGDDAALLTAPVGHELVLTTDTLVDGVHFPQSTAPEHVGYKALAVNLSDLATMGAEPAWALLALTLPEPDTAWVEAFAAGFAELAREHEVALVGGDTSRGPLSVTVQAAGFVPAGQALTRGGACPGDGIFVTGTLGDAAAGLAVVQGRLDAGKHAETLVQRLNRPTPRVAAGLALRGIAGSTIDLSDGLGADLEHLLGGDKLGAQIDMDALPGSDALRAVSSGTGRWNYQFAGDDYELCFTAGEALERRMSRVIRAGACPISRIGRVTDTPGLRCCSAGQPVSTPTGWRHFHA